VSAYSQNRLLTFEIGSSLFALPIEGVHEVAETTQLACIPTLSRDVAGVINYRGDALPVVQRDRLLPTGEGALAAPQHVLVISDRPSSPPCLGLHVDRVLGLVDGTPARAASFAQRGEAERSPVDWGSDPVAERRPLDGRMAQIVDPARLVARARKVIEDALARGE
jgi:chemotaxis signal transduction protein